MQGSRIAKPSRTTVGRPTASTKTASTGFHGAPPVKSMRALGKENEELQQQVKELSDALRVANEAKATIKANTEKHTKQYQEKVSALEKELLSLQNSSTEELSRLNGALQKVTDEAKDKAAETSAVQEELAKKQKASAEYQSRLERLGIDAISLKDWAQREDTRHKDVEMFNEQIKTAMEELRESNTELEKDVKAAAQVAERIAQAKERLRMAAETTPEHIADDEDLDAEDTDNMEDQRVEDEQDADEVQDAGENQPAAEPAQSLKQIEEVHDSEGPEAQDQEDLCDVQTSAAAEEAEAEAELLLGEGAEEFGLDAEAGVEVVAAHDDDSAEVQSGTGQVLPNAAEAPGADKALPEPCAPEQHVAAAVPEALDNPEAKAKAQDDSEVQTTEEPEEASDQGSQKGDKVQNLDVREESEAEAEDAERFKGLRGAEADEDSAIRREKRKSFDSAIC